MTHHTRQSAIGLPVIEKRVYGGTEYSVTEYTMSEIIASVYEQSEYAGKKEGILFLDEINCVSETLMPAILQFLQYKCFGGHKLPEGWIIVAAGNPMKYNQSVHRLDTVMLDRLKYIEIDADFGVWKKYALERRLHPAIISYLTLKPENFFSVQAEPGGRRFVTARAWEDLSEMLLTFEELGIPAGESLFGQYLQHDQISSEFSLYYELVKGFENKYRVDEIMESGEELPALKDARFDEKLCVMQLLLHRLHTLLQEQADSEALLNSYDYFSNSLEALLRDSSKPFSDSISELIASRSKSMQMKKSFGLLSPKDEEAELSLLRLIDSGSARVSLNPPDSADSALRMFRDFPSSERRSLEQLKAYLEAAIKNCLVFAEKTFGRSQESAIFLTELTSHEPTARFMKKHLKALYDSAISALDLKSQSDALREKIRAEFSH
jgi:hypothetical protein